MTTPIKSTAAHVLSTGEATDEEARALAGAVLGDDSLTPSRTTRSLSDLQTLYDKVNGVEGQTERARAIKDEMEIMS